MVLPNARGILPKDHIQTPVQLVLDAPVSPNGACKCRRIDREGTEEKADRISLLVP